MTVWLIRDKAFSSKSLDNLFTGRVFSTKKAADNYIDGFGYDRSLYEPCRTTVLDIVVADCLPVFKVAEVAT
jgi:hypothetical protein